MFRYSKGELTLTREILQRNLKLVSKIVIGVSQLAPPTQVTSSLSLFRVIFKTPIYEILCN